MKKLRYGMVGGGPGSFIGDAHRRAINLDGQAELVAGCFSRTPEKCRETGAQLGIAPDRCYAARTGQRPEQRTVETERAENFFVPASGECIDHARRGGIGILLLLDARQEKMEIIGQHQKALCA
mgnify:CR=1 FL=1